MIRGSASGSGSYKKIVIKWKITEKFISEAMHEILKKGLQNRKDNRGLSERFPFSGCCCRRSRDYTARVSSRVEAELKEL